MYYILLMMPKNSKTYSKIYHFEYTMYLQKKNPLVLAHNSKTRGYILNSFIKLLRNPVKSM